MKKNPFAELLCSEKKEPLKLAIPQGKIAKEKV